MNFNIEEVKILIDGVETIDYRLKKIIKHKQGRSN